MSQRIDDELQKLEDAGQKPKTIYVGAQLCVEVANEKMLADGEGVAASLVDKKTEVEPALSYDTPTDYKGIPLVCVDEAATDYLLIEADEETRA